MIVTPIKTTTVTANASSIFELLDKYILELTENSVVAITSKVVSLCEGRVIPISDSNKEKLALHEADYYIPASQNQYGKVLTIKHHALIISAGVDSRNSGGYLVLLPKDPMTTAIAIWEHLRSKHKISNLGVVITDSHTLPLRKGAVGVAIAYCGIQALNQNQQVSDVFGEKMSAPVNLIDGLAAAAVLNMGETNELTPISLITDAHQVIFCKKPPTRTELNEFFLSREEDIYSVLLTSEIWQKGEGNLN